MQILLLKRQNDAFHDRKYHIDLQGISNDRESTNVTGSSIEIHTVHVQVDVVG